MGNLVPTGVVSRSGNMESTPAIADGSFCRRAEHSSQGGVDAFGLSVSQSHESEDKMATTDSAKTTSKTNSRKSAAGSRSTANRRGASDTRPPSQRGRQDGRQNTGPYWATTVASLVGVGVALGFGLFATRRRWMPYAEDWNEYLHDQWDFHERDENDDRDHTDDTPPRFKDDAPPKADETTTAIFPGDVSPQSNPTNAA
jgi:hypothetical protein